MFNLALGWAFLISAIASPGGKAMSLLFDTEVLRTLPSYQQVLATIFANYWIPAILIYLLLKWTRANRFLNATFGVHALFGIANIILTLYAGLRVFTATVEGGGTTYALGIIGGIVAVPCWLALAIGTILLVTQSANNVGSGLAREEIIDRNIFATPGVIVAALALLIPIIFFGWLYVGKSEEIGKVALAHSIKNSRFEELCNSNLIDIRHVATEVKSVLFLRPSEISYGLLNHLDFIEIYWQEWERKKGDAPYARHRKKEGSKAIVNGKVDVLSERTYESEAQYEISFNTVTSEEDKALGLWIEETTIRDRRSGELLAAFSFVKPASRSAWVDNSKFCPRGFDPVNYKFNMVSFVLGLMDESSSEKFAEEIAKRANQRG